MSWCLHLVSYCQLWSPPLGPNMRQHLLLQLLFAEERLSQWQWYRGTSQGNASIAAPQHSSAQHSSPQHSSAQSRDRQHDHGQQQHVGAATLEGFSAIPGAVGQLYVPVKDDEGCILRVQCTPGSRCVPAYMPCHPGPASLLLFLHQLLGWGLCSWLLRSLLSNTLHVLQASAAGHIFLFI